MKMLPRRSVIQKL
nr:unnamed protein product [Callosobruchus analis]